MKKLSLIVFLGLSVALLSNKCQNQDGQTVATERPILDRPLSTGRQPQIGREAGKMIQSGAVVEGKLVLELEHPGGCGEHDYHLYFSGAYVKTLPPGAPMMLTHEQTTDDTCSQTIRQVVRFDLSPLGNSGYDSIWISIQNHEGEYVFRP